MVGLGEAIEGALGRSALRAAMVASGLPDISLFTRHAYLPHLGQLAFLDAVARQTDARLADILEPRLRIGDYGAFGAYITGGRNFGEALARTVAATRWHTSHDRTALTRCGDVARLEYTSDIRHATGYREYAPLAACVLLSIARPYLGKGPVARRIRFDIPRQGSLSEWESFFGCEVRFDCERLALEFDSAALSRRRRDAAAATIEDVRRESSVPAPRDLVGAIAQIIRLALLDGEVRLDAVARQIGFDPRTLRRRLEAEGVTFRDLLAGQRTERALELLGDGAYSVRDVALLLGCSDAAHFVHAFKRETGRTPGALRSPTR